jgi:uncharacterized protein
MEKENSRTFTFIVTKNCQLACKYCYLVGKNDKELLTFAVAKRAIDYILACRDIFCEDFAVYDFIGGEPLLEIDLIEQICQYLIGRTKSLNHPWANSYQMRISTNGLLYNSKKVQRFIAKYKSRLAIRISIDGTEKKHDTNRVYKNGKGSYQTVMQNVLLWLTQFPDAGTKMTVSSEDLPYVKESVVHLINLGIRHISLNTVFEDVWKEGDDKIYEWQLMELADYLIENELYKELDLYVFDESTGKPLDRYSKYNWCGSLMLAVDASGNFYPCLRFAKFSLRNREALAVGNVYEGLNLNKLRPFYTIDRYTQSSQKCMECEVASGCGWCPAENYDTADTPTIFQRSMAICKMHKARVRAKDYYQNKLKTKIYT